MHVIVVGCHGLASSPGSPLARAHMTFAPEQNLRRGRAWYAKSRDPKLRNFLTCDLAARASLYCLPVRFAVLLGCISLTSCIG